MTFTFTVMKQATQRSLSLNLAPLSITRVNAIFWSVEQRRGFYQYAVGYKEVEGKEGTWRDCEDGQLSNNPVAQGAVDSAVSFQLEIPPQGYGIVHYWIACGTSLGEVSALDASSETRWG